MRRTLSVALLLPAAALGSLILGEYELTMWTALAAGVVLGFGAAEILLSVGRWRGPAPAALAAAVAGAAVWWAGRIDANFGIDPYPQWAWVGVGAGVAVAAGRVLLSPAAPDDHPHTPAS